MSVVPLLRQFVNDRLSAAAEEILGVFEKKIVEYEDEILRQRKLLDTFLNPEVNLQRIEHQQQHACEDQKQQQVNVQRTTSSLDQEDPPSVHIKEEELCSSDEGEQLGLKQETDAFMVAAAHQESDHIFNYSIENVRSLVAHKTSISVSVQSSVVPEVKSEQRPLSHSSEEAEGQDWEGGQHGDSGSTTEELYPEYNEAMSTFYSQTGEASLKCHKCEKVFKQWGWFWRHVTNHPGEKFTCKTCGKVFTLNGDLKRHMRIHTVEKAFTCTICMREFRSNSHLKVHMRIHTDQKPFVCKTCSKGFYSVSQLRKHRSQDGCGRPFTCPTCGKTYLCYGHLRAHLRTHTGENFPHCSTEVPVAVTNVKYEDVYLGTHVDEST